MVIIVAVVRLKDSAYKDTTGTIPIG